MESKRGMETTMPNNHDGETLIMPLSKEANRNRMWWKRWLEHRPWWEYADTEVRENTRKALVKELAGHVPPLTGQKPRSLGETSA